VKIDRSAASTEVDEYEMHLSLRLLLLLLCCLWCASLPSCSALSVPALFSSSMVLQRAPSSAVMWGWTDEAGARVKLAISQYGQLVTTLTTTSALVPQNVQPGGGGGGADSEPPAFAFPWQVTFPPQAASTNWSISIYVPQDPSVQQIDLDNVAFGDVYLCGGQSNMQMTVPSVFNATAEIADSARYTGLRVFTASNPNSSTPLFNVTSMGGYSWGVSGPSTVGLGDWDTFSAMCFFFGRNLFVQLDEKVPIGLMASMSGNSRIVSWASPEALSHCTPAPNTPDASGNLPSSLFNGALYPLLNLSLSGVLWSQGEADVWDNWIFADFTDYSCRLGAFITDMRSRFRNSANHDSLWFGIAQLAPNVNQSGLYPIFRAAQESAIAPLSNASLAIAIELNDPTSPWLPVHYRHKQPVGQRLAALALRDVYGRDEIVARGPALMETPIIRNSRQVQDNNKAADVAAKERSMRSSRQRAQRHQLVSSSPQLLFLNFSDPLGGSGLSAFGTDQCVACCSESPFLLELGFLKWQRLEIANIDSQQRTIHLVLPTDGQWSGGSSSSSSSSSSSDTVRQLTLLFDYEDAPQCALRNDQGFPVAPFKIQFDVLSQEERRPALFRIAGE